DFGLESRNDSAEAVPAIRPPAKAAAADAERRVVLAALESTGGNVTHAAARLGLSRRGLQLKLKQLGLRPKN
ncbi:MAG TPA: helix-turn-helix domain-containing protein, partial [Candidatus Polarisedimenticolia bacterium]|nr:helix-turn-helix domain-containing protein [Candidatus Polarisedimenticolia bacterium]